MNPRGRLFPVALRTWIDPTRVLLAGAAATPRIGAQQEVPRELPATPRGFAHAMPLTLRGQDRFFGAPGQPPANPNWPVPRGAIPAIALRNWIDQARIALAAAIQPVVNPPAPNPRCAALPVALRGWTDTGQLARLLAQAEVPLSVAPTMVRARVEPRRRLSNRVELRRRFLRGP